MYLAFLHGEAIVFGLLLTSLIFWSAAIIFLIWRWRYVVAHRLKVVIGYLLLVALPCLALLRDENGLSGFIFGTAFTLPLSFFLPELILDVVESRALAGILFLCGVVNAAVLYLIASLWSRQAR